MTLFAPDAPSDPADLFHLVYVSSAVVLMSLDELKQILAQARSKNARLGVTGLLLYHDGSCMQLLEGSEPVVRGLYAHIAGDRRHRGCQTLLQERVTERLFPHWSMGFRNLSSPEVRSLPGYSEFLNVSALGEVLSHDPTRAQRLLQMFRRNLR